MLNGGDRGPVVVPGNAANSLMMKAIRWSDPEIEMPPAEAGNRLSEQQIADFENWINNGAFDPRTNEPGVSRKSWDEKFAERLDWWSLRPIERKEFPKTSDIDWNSSSIDAFLRDAMQQKGVVPAQLAEPRTLIRRATLVLTGLPPKPSDVDSFVTDYATEPDNAYAMMVDKPAFDQLKAIKNEVRKELIHVWHRNAEGIQEESIRKACETFKDKATTIEHPLSTWIALEKEVLDGRELVASWSIKADEFSKETKARKEFNTSRFELLYDFRDGIPNGWSKDGMGLREPQSPAPDLVVAHEGDAAIKLLLPRGVYTCLLSDKMNGALRSPVLPKSMGKISFEVLGGNFSLARVVCNNCQLNYDQQHSIHHPEWSWVTVNVPSGTDVLYPYAELLTYWDNPKFPDPLGTLGKDTENQLEPGTSIPKTDSSPTAHRGAPKPK